MMAALHLLSTNGGLWRKWFPVLVAYYFLLTSVASLEDTLYMPSSTVSHNKAEIQPVANSNSTTPTTGDKQVDTDERSANLPLYVAAQNDSLSSESNTAAGHAMNSTRTNVAVAQPHLPPVMKKWSFNEGMVKRSLIVITLITVFLAVVILARGYARRRKRSGQKRAYDSIPTKPSELSEKANMISVLDDDDDDDEFTVFDASHHKLIKK